MHIQAFPFKLDSGKFQVSDEEKEHVEVNTGLGFGETHVPSVVADTEFRKRTADIPSAKGSEEFENGKRPYGDFCAEVANKRAKQEEQAISISSEEKNSSEEPSLKIAAPVLYVNDEILAATDEDYLQRTGLDQLEDVRFPLSEHSHLRHIPIGSDHQADLPKWTPLNLKSSCQSRFYDTHSSLDVSASCPAMDGQVGRSVINCDCIDEGSVICVRQHVMEAREKLRILLGQEKFVELGFPDMGEDVADRWTEMEENLFHMVVSSNPATLGRNFWTVLPHAFPSRSFQELVCYYFNVFILRKRADQNRFDPLSVDSDNDDWQENSNGNFVMSDEEEEGEEEDEEDSGVESPADGNSSAEDDVSEELDFQDEVDDEEDDEFYCGKPKPCIQPIERNSTDCSLDQDVQDVQDDSCTSFKRLYNVDRDHENSHTEHRKYEYFDGDCDSKPWEINYIGGTEKDFDFFPTCSVLEEVFGKGSWDKDARDGSDFR